MALEHIKIPEITPRVVYNIAAGTPSVSIPFPFFAASDIRVTVSNALFSGFVLTQGVHYTVIGNGGFDKGFPGGTVSFIQAPTVQTTVLVERHVPISRMVDFPNSGPLQTAALNTELDKSVAIDQQLEAEIGALDSRIDILEVGDPRLGRAMLFPPEDLLLNHTLPIVLQRNDRTLGFATDGSIQMRSALTIPDIGRDQMLPPAAGRANKVLGWDATGGFLNLVDVVGGAIVPNADNITFQANGSTVVRSVGDVLRERLSIKDFGTHVGEGVQANDDAALVAAVNYINSTAGAGIALFYPTGVYFHGPCPVKLTRTYCTIEGDGTNNTVIVFTGPGTWLTLGDTTTPTTPTENQGFRNLTLSLASTTGLFFLLENTVNIRFENINTVDADGFLRLGVFGPPSTPAYHTYVRNCGGTSRHTNTGLITCRYGGGLYIDLCHFAVSSPGVSGNDFLDFIGNVNFVVVRVTTTFLVNYWTICMCNLTNGGTVADFIFMNCSLVNCVSNIFFLWSPPGASILGVRIALCAMNTDTATGIFLGGGGINDEHNWINNGILGAGGSAIAGNSNALHIIISGNRIKNCNRTNIAQAAIHISAGSGFNVVDNVGNDAESAFRAPWGIIMGAGMDRYLVTGNRIGGTVGGTKAEDDGLASHLRRMTNNGFAWSGFNGYAIIAQAGPDGSGNVINSTPYVCDAIVSGSGFVAATSINGVPIGDATTGTFHLEPGDILNVQASGPNVMIRRYE